MYHDFITRAGDLLPNKISPWSVLFAMQHHGVPTRLLDWSDNFAIALHFAMKNATGEAAVWALDPYKLTENVTGEESIYSPNSLGDDYYFNYLSPRHKVKHNAISLLPLRHHPRVNRQRGGFTFHGKLDESLEDMHANCVNKIVIPPSMHDSARYFLRLAGVLEFALFPDLDGLARDMLDDYKHLLNKY